MSEKAAIMLLDVSKTYFLGKGIEVRALRGVTLTVPKGEFISIMGPSGSGKTTLLNIIGTMDKPTSGRVVIDGVDVTNMSEGELAYIRREKIGFVFQAYNLISTLSALENVVLPMLLTGRYTEREARERAMELLRLVGLEERADHKPKQLSGGQQQRVAIARALANNPAFVLMDEPTGALDTVTGSKIMALCRVLNEAFGQTFVVVSHSPAIAKAANKIYYIRDGMLFEKPPREIMEFNASLTEEELRRVLTAQLRILMADVEALRRGYREGVIPPDKYRLYRDEIMRRLRFLEGVLRS